MSTDMVPVGRSTVERLISDLTTPPRIWQENLSVNMCNTSELVLSNILKRYGYTIDREKVLKDVHIMGRNERLASLFYRVFTDLLPEICNVLTNYISENIFYAKIDSSNVILLIAKSRGLYLKIDRYSNTNTYSCYLCYESLSLGLNLPDSYSTKIFNYLGGLIGNTMGIVRNRISSIIIELGYNYLSQIEPKSYDMMTSIWYLRGVDVNAVIYEHCCSMPGVYPMADYYWNMLSKENKLIYKSQSNWRRWFTNDLGKVKDILTEFLKDKVRGLQGEGCTLINMESHRKLSSKIAIYGTRCLVPSTEENEILEGLYGEIGLGFEYEKIKRFILEEMQYLLSRRIYQLTIKRAVIESEVEVYYRDGYLTSTIDVLVLYNPKIIYNKNN